MAILEKPPAISESDVLEAVRWLLQNESYQSHIQEKNWGTYPYWKAVKYRAEAWFEGIPPKGLWALFKYYRRGVAKKISLGDTWKHKFSYTSTPILEERLDWLNLHAGGTLLSKSPIDATDKHHYLLSSIMEEAIASSAIEGAVTTRQIAKEMIRSGRNPQDKSEQMILNNYRTILMLKERLNEPLSEDLIFAIHESVTAGTLREEAVGAFRQDDETKLFDGKGNVVHQPMPAIELEAWMKRICDFANETKPQGHYFSPIVRASILHFLIGYVHPFEDGNGRIARALFYWFLLKEGFGLIEHISISRIILHSPSAYYQAFMHTELDENDLTYFVYHQTEVLKKAFNALEQYLKRKADERKKAQQLFRYTDRLTPRQVVLIEELIREPDRQFTTKEIIERFKITGPTARKTLETLVEMGLMIRRKIFLKRYGYFRSPNFETVLRELRIRE